MGGRDTVKGGEKGKKRQSFELWRSYEEDLWRRRSKEKKKEKCLLDIDPC